jgi:hypothetical protein
MKTLTWTALGGLALVLASPIFAQGTQPAQNGQRGAGTPAANGQAPRQGGGGPPRETAFPAIASGAWTGPRTADGQPDVTGFWSNTIGNHQNFTDPQGGRQRPDRPHAPSRVTDPADGEIPYLPAARALQEDFAKHAENPDKPSYIEPLVRCAPAGVPKTFTWHGFEIRQYPGKVFLWFNSGWRLIHLDGSAHLDSSIKLWQGDSRGHWEGNTLVVDTTNNNGKALFDRHGNFMSENATAVERFVFQPDGKRFNYVVTITDPTVYSRPWTATIPVRRYTTADKPDGWNYEVSAANHPGAPVSVEWIERTCVENNAGFGGGAVGVPAHAVVIAR